MSKVRRVYVEKKDAFAVAAKGLSHEIKSYLGVQGLEGVRVLIAMMWRIFQKLCMRRRAAQFFQSRRSIFCMKKSFLWQKMKGRLQWNICRDSLTSGRILPYSVSVF